MIYPVTPSSQYSRDLLDLLYPAPSRIWPPVGGQARTVRPRTLPTPTGSRNLLGLLCLPSLRCCQKVSRLEQCAPKPRQTPKSSRDLLGLLRLPLLRCLQEGGSILPPQDGHTVLQLGHLCFQGPLTSQVGVLAFLHTDCSRRSRRPQCAWTCLPWCVSYQMRTTFEGNGAVKLHVPLTAQTRAPHVCRACSCPAPPL